MKPPKPNMTLMEVFAEEEKMKQNQVSEMKTRIIIDHPKYGDRRVFSSLEEAEDYYERSCAGDPGFAGLLFEYRWEFERQIVVDESGNRVGCVLSKYSGN